MVLLEGSGDLRGGDKVVIGVVRRALPSFCLCFLRAKE